MRYINGISACVLTVRKSSGGVYRHRQPAKISSENGYNLNGVRQLQLDGSRNIAWHGDLSAWRKLAASSAASQLAAESINGVSA